MSDALWYFIGGFSIGFSVAYYLSKLEGRMK